jgi:methyl-accepting chemotaxis protein
MKNITLRSRLMLVLLPATVILTLVLSVFVMHQKQISAENAAAELLQDGIWALSKVLLHEAEGFKAAKAADGRINGLVVQDSQLAIPESMTDSIYDGMGVHVTYFRYLPETNEFIRLMTSIKSADGKRAVGTPLDPSGPVMPVLAQGNIYTGAAKILGENYLTRYEPVFDQNGKIAGAVFSGKSMAEYHASIWRDAALFLSLAFVMNILVVGACYWAMNSAMRPIKDMATTVQKLKDRDFSADIPTVNMNDEIGAITRSLGDLRVSLQQAEVLQQQKAADQAQQAEVVAKLSTALHRMADGDLTVTIDEPFAENYDVLRQNLNASSRKMHDSLAHIAVVSQRIETQSRGLVAASQELAHRTEVQAATLEQTAAAMDEMTAGFKSAATNLQEVEAIVGKARQDADQSGAVVNGAISAMEAIEKSSAQIAQIIGVIDDIAFQTNLLALNAGVEAARAGESGRGFAVVASEVGALAQRASTAAKEINALISVSSEHVDAGVDRVKQAGAALHVISRCVSDIAGLTSAITTGAQEQATGLNEINLGVIQLDKATQQNAIMAQESNGASQSMETSALELGSLVSKFRFSDTAGQNDAEVHLLRASPSTGQNTLEVGFGASAQLRKDQESKTDGMVDMPRLAKTANARGAWQDF